MTLERLRRTAAQSDEQTDDEVKAASGEDADAIDADEEAESSGSRLGMITKSVGVALAAATAVVAVRRFRRRSGE